MSSLAEELPREINRVRELKSQYEELRGTPGVNVEFAVGMMDRSLTEAIEASTSGDVVRMLRAYEDLKGFEK